MRRQTVMEHDHFQCGRGKRVRISSCSLIRHWCVDMSYYTGTIFEITMDDFGGSVGGGGRYDKMIGKFTGQDTPACGFSIGFERIVMLLLESGYQSSGKQKKKRHILLEKKLSTGRYAESACNWRKQSVRAGKQVLIVNMKKNKKFQKEQLAEEGYADIVDCYGFHRTRLIVTQYVKQRKRRRIMAESMQGLKENSQMCGVVSSKYR